ncbi:MAG TPA: DUF309 domain-containing protein [Nitrososphaerales archaeon]|nr:DUF309 domain-containing protein [Nitrososphaerales archaeon]
MRFLVRLTSEDRSRERFLSSVRSLARSLGADARNPKWTSYGALEIDIFSPTRADYDLFLAAVSPIYRVEFSRDLNVAPVHHSEDEIVAEAREYFNSERYWECHETLESLWRIKSGEEKHLLQGLILICAAYVHHQKGEEAVAFSVLGRAMARLDSEVPSYHGLNVETIKERTAAIASAREFSTFTL